MEPTPETTRRTFRLELWRSIPVGIIEYLFIPLAGLIALEHYQASDWQKALLLAISGGGMVASIAIVPLVRKLNWELTHSAAVFNLIGAVGIACAAAFPDSLTLYMTGISIGFFAFMLPLPLLTQVYQNNFPTARRGKIFAVTATFRGIIAIIFAWAAGKWIDADIENFKPLLWWFAGFALLGAAATWIMPKVKLSPGSTNPFTAFRWLKEDRKFRVLIISWMLMGIGNLTSLKIWTEYFANEDYGNNFTAFEVTLLTFIIPNIVKLVFTYPWGWLFDRLNFYFLRIILNVLFCSAILVVFYGESFFVIAIGTGLQGFAFAGGNIAWSLWVTKIAPPEHTAEYMSVHTCTTGLRGIAAPIIGFALLRGFGSGVAIFSAILILIASLIILPEARRIRSRGKSSGTP